MYTIQQPGNKFSIWILPMAGDKKPVPLATTPFTESQAQFSPDGRWVAYASDESRRLTVYVRPFSMSPSGAVAEPGAKWQVSAAYGHQPRWRSEGCEIDYLA